MHNLYCFENRINGKRYYYISWLDAEPAFQKASKQSFRDKSKFRSDVQEYGRQSFMVYTLGSGMDYVEANILMKRRLAEDKGAMRLTYETKYVILCTVLCVCVIVASMWLH